MVVGWADLMVAVAWMDVAGKAECLACEVFAADAVLECRALAAASVAGAGSWVDVGSADTVRVVLAGADVLQVGVLSVCRAEAVSAVREEPGCIKVADLKVVVLVVESVLRVERADPAVAAGIRAEAGVMAGMISGINGYHKRV